MLLQITRKSKYHMYVEITPKGITCPNVSSSFIIFRAVNREHMKYLVVYIDILGSTIADYDRRFVCSRRRKDIVAGRVSRGDRRVLKQSSPQISVANRLLSPVPKSHPHTLKTSRAACVRGGAHRASAGPPLTFTPILSPYDWCL